MVLTVMPALLVGALMAWGMYNALYPPKKLDYSTRKLTDTISLYPAPLECSPFKYSSLTASHHHHQNNNNLTWVLTCELYRKPQNGVVARAVLRFRPKLSLRIRLKKGSDHKQVRITTAEAKTLLSNHHFDSSPDHLLVLPFMEMETQHGNNEEVISIPNVPTRLVGSTASFTTSHLKVGNNIASTFLQHIKRAREKDLRDTLRS